MPLPPYIKRLAPDQDDENDYQTVWADKLGAVAASTAGLHFTPGLLAALDDAGIKRQALTLLARRMQCARIRSPSRAVLLPRGAPAVIAVWLTHLIPAAARSGHRQPWRLRQPTTLAVCLIVTVVRPALWADFAPGQGAGSSGLLPGNRGQHHVLSAGSFGPGL
jgi:hypothetical protein